jgi:hypothetical protein
MAARGWANSTLTAIGVAAGVAAAQAGLGYGLGILAWQPVQDAAGESLWLASLAWVLWIAASSTVLGAVYTNRHRARDATGRVIEMAQRISIALAAAIGASLIVVLVMLPARAARRADNFQPQMTAGAYAVVGVILGLVIAIAAVNVRVMAANVVASAAWVWALAAVSVIDAVRAKRAVGTAQLATWQFTEGGWFRETLYLPGALLMLGGALVVGVFAALPADRREDNRVAIAISGAVGPVLVTAAYFLSAPRYTVRTEQLSAYLFAPYAVIAGLAGSVLVAALGPLRPRRARPKVPPVASPGRATVTPTGSPASPAGDGELTEWTRGLAGVSTGTSDTVRESKPGTGKTPTLQLAGEGIGQNPGRPAAKTAGQAAAKPAAKPAGQAVAKPAGKPAGEPAGKPAVEPYEPAVTTTEADPAGSTATGRATVTEPLWPEKAKPRKRRGRNS